MKKIFYSACFFFIFASAFVFSEEMNVQLDLDLKTLSLMDESDLNKLIDNNIVVAIDGLLSSINHFEYSEAKIQIRLSIINGKWKGTEKIEVYQCEVILDDLSWLEIFPERMPRIPDENIIEVNSYLLVLGTIEAVEFRDGQKVIILHGNKLRKIS